jgi:hypothetical protein
MLRRDPQRSGPLPANQRRCTRSLAKAVAGLNAKAKGRRLWIFEPPKLAPREQPNKRGLGDELWIDLCGQAVPAKEAKDGVRAVVKDKSIGPDAVAAYLTKLAGDDLTAARNAMQDFASRTTSTSWQPRRSASTSGSGRRSRGASRDGGRRVSLIWRRSGRCGDAPDARMPSANPL